MISVALATPFGARVVGFPTGLTGTVRVRILDNIGGTSYGPTTAGITENPAGSGSYSVALTSSAVAGEYAVLFDQGGTLTPSTTADSELIVASSLAGDVIAPGAAFETTVGNMPSGLVGTIGVRILNNVTGATTLARTTAGIIEFPAGSGFYTATLTAPATDGYYSAFWDTGTVSPSTTAAESLNVGVVAVGGSLPSGIDLCTLADVRAFMKWKSSYTAEDALAQTAITGASQAIMDAVEREFAPATLSELRTLQLHPARRINGSVLLDLCPYDLRTVSLFRLDPEASSPTTLIAGTGGYTLTPVDTPQGVYTGVRLSNQVAYSSTMWQEYGFAQVEITGAWGFANVPTPVRDACVETVAARLRRDASAFNIEDQEDPRLVAPNPAMVFSIPPGAWKKLMPYRRSSGVF
jgi:hypothetical protein